MYAITLPTATYRPTIKHSKRFKIYSTAYKNVDPYRETSLRYMGYANELGEAFTSFLPEWGLPASYCIAASYVMFDTIDKGEKAYHEAEEEDKFVDTLRISTETLTWQLLASVFWPGSIIRVIVNMSANLVSQAHMDDNQFAHFLPTLIGLSAIPLIVKPIDSTVDTLMETSISKVINGEIETTEQAQKAMMTAMGSISVPPVMYLLASIIKRIEA
jgi:fission process protein 1